MINVEGYKAFYGTMLITSTNPKFPPETITAEWLYKPEYDCWYGRGRSFTADICEVVEDLTGTLGIPERTGGKNMDELKPCPFCGGKAQFCIVDAVRGSASYPLGIQSAFGKYYNPDHGNFLVRCLKCGAMTKQKHTKQAVINSWNRRFDND